MNNMSLQVAKAIRYSEFYTRFVDVQDELNHYSSEFKDKVIYCNCDVPERSAFWRYFHLNFKRLGLKKLIATYYNREGHSFAFSYWGGNDADVSCCSFWELEGNGDFRSDECIELLNTSDIIVTNPPFDLFREYVDLIMRHNKKCLILGSINAVMYVTVFPYIMHNKLWLGYRSLNKDMLFDVPCDYVDYLVNNKQEGSAYRVIDDKVYMRLASVCWYTNLYVAKRFDPFLFKRVYDSKSYDCFDNYDAININRVADIPYGYNGVMGVPVTFLDKYNPDQFEIVGCSNKHGRPAFWDNSVSMIPYVNGKEIYKRIFVRVK